MGMKLITEVHEQVEHIIEEAATEGMPKKHFIQGVFMEGGVVNNYRAILKVLNGAGTFLSNVLDNTMACGSIEGRSIGSDHTIYVDDAEYETVSNGDITVPVRCGFALGRNTSPTNGVLLNNWYATDEFGGVSTHTVMGGVNVGINEGIM